MTLSRIAAAAVVCLFVASCTKPAPGVDSAAAPAAAPAVAGTAAAPSPLLVYYAYTAVAVAADGAAAQPGKTFKSTDRIQVVVLLRGQADASEVKVEWSSGAGASLGSQQATVPVAGEAEARLDITQAAALAPGAYKALVFLNGAPSWELAFDVSE